MDKQSAKEVLAIAEELYRQSPDLGTFFREIFGVGGAVCSKFPTLDEREEFHKTEEYGHIRAMMAKLNPNTASEPNHTLTIRCSKRQHTKFRAEAMGFYISMNKLAIFKLQQPVDADLLGAISEEKAISIRLPKSLHETLKREAVDWNTSMNKLAVAKLIKPIDRNLILK